VSDEPQLLRVEGLHTYYGQSHILRGISLAIAQRQSVGLMGRNGMGKTTLIRSIMGLVPPRSGRLSIDGRDATREPAFLRARAGLAYVPEGRGIFASLSVAEHLAVAERPGADGRTEWTVPRALDLFPRLGQRLDHSGAQLSGGEQQMLAVARALLTNPRLLILDEATEGLAPVIRAEIWAVLQRLKADGQAILVIDKNLKVLQQIADRHYIIEKGRTVWRGDSAALKAEAETVRGLVGL
jgi:branched-chain amino acid transport system ATP-binding protein